MDRRERSGDTLAAMQAFGEGLLAGIWTAIPAIITAVNLAKKTVQAQPAVRAQVQAQDGSFSWVAMPLCVDVPLFFPSGGGATLTFPVAAGDECLLVFASRCIDGWWQSGGIQNQPDLRKLDLSDGFAFVGISSVPKVPASISATAVELRNNDRSAYISLNPTNGNIAANTSGRIDLTASGGVWANGKRVDVHTHGGVQTGGGTTAVNN